MQNYLDQASVKNEQITPSLLAYIPEARNISSVMNDQQKNYEAKSFHPQSQKNNNYQSSNDKIIVKKKAENYLPNINSEIRDKKYEKDYSVINSKDQPSVIEREQKTSTIYDTNKQFNYSKTYQLEDYENKNKTNKNSMIPLEKPKNLNYSKNYQQEHDFKHDQQNVKTTNYSKNFNYSNIYQSETNPIKQDDNQQKNTIPEKRNSTDYSSKIMQQNYQSSLLYPEKSKIEHIQQNSKLNQNPTGIKSNISNVINPPPKSQIFDYNTQKELDELIANRYYQEEMEEQARMDEETARTFAIQQEEGLTVSTINNIERTEKEHQLAMDEYLAHEFKGFFFFIFF